MTKLELDTRVHAPLRRPRRESFSFLDDEADNVFPELRTLHLGLFTDAQTQGLGIPPLRLPKIRNLHLIGWIFHEDVGSIIQGASRCLETLIWEPFYSPTRSSLSCTFPRLHSLALGGDEKKIAIEFWKAPLLKHLRIDDTWHSVGAELHQHANFPSITSLTLTQYSYNLPVLQPFFQRHPNLRAIRMHDGHGLETFLSYAASHGAIFRNVRKFELHFPFGCEGKCDILSSLLNAMTTRSPPGRTSDTSVVSMKQENIPFDLVITSPKVIPLEELLLLKEKYPSNVFITTKQWPLSDAAWDE